MKRFKWAKMYAGEWEPVKLLNDDGSDFYIAGWEGICHPSDFENFEWGDEIEMADRSER
jgi:hypothetical protein